MKDSVVSAAPSRHEAIRVSPRHLLVVGAIKVLVLQVLLSVHAAMHARCVVVVPRGTRLLRLSPLCAEYLELDLGGADDERFVQQVHRLAAALPGLTVIAADCAGERLASRVRDRLRVPLAPTPDAAMLDRLENKWRFVQLCQELGLRVPETRLVASKHALAFDETARALGLPFVVKPVDERGATGVRVVCGEADFRRRVRDDPAYRHAPLLAQRFVRGMDVGVDLLALGGRVVSLAMQQPLRPRDESAPVGFFFHPALEHAAHTLARATGYHGVMNVDARLEEGTGELFLLEANPRFWRTLLASTWCGLNFVTESLQPPGQGLRRLSAGRADTYCHPLFRPALWAPALLDPGPRGRLVRRMLVEPSTLAGSAKALWRRRVGRNALALAAEPSLPRCR